MHETEMVECRRRIALGASLNTLLKYNPDFKAVITDGFLRDEVLAQSLNINNNKPATIQFLDGAATFKAYLDKVLAEALQAQMDLTEYQNLL